MPAHRFLAKTLRALLCALLSVAATSVAASELVVFAAASLKTALDQIAADFEASTGQATTLVLAGSSVLARQIAAGAPADVFLSANTAWMDDLDERGLIEPGTRRDLLSNSLVLIAPAPGEGPVEIDHSLDLAAKLDGGFLAMALTEAVPAGQYGRAALEHVGAWEGVAPSVAQTDNVRAALALVALREAPLGIVYATDAIAEDRVSVVGQFPADSHPPIVYPGAAIAGGDVDGARAFLDFLASPTARETFAAQGFKVLGD